jgi:hypothetical protein
MRRASPWRLPEQIERTRRDDDPGPGTSIVNPDADPRGAAYRRYRAGARMSRAWFRPKKFGLGAMPATWQGWAVTIAMIVAVAAVARLAERRSSAWLALIVPVLAAFLFVAATHTEGGWRWRWRWGGEQ